MTRPSTLLSALELYDLEFEALLNPSPPLPSPARSLDSFGPFSSAEDDTESSDIASLFEEGSSTQYYNPESPVLHSTSLPTPHTSPVSRPSPTLHLPPTACVLGLAVLATGPISVLPDTPAGGASTTPLPLEDTQLASECVEDPRDKGWDIVEEGRKSSGASATECQGTDVAGPSTSIEEHNDVSKKRKRCASVVDRLIDDKENQPIESSAGPPSAVAPVSPHSAKRRKVDTVEWDQTPSDLSASTSGPSSDGPETPHSPSPETPRSPSPETPRSPSPETPRSPSPVPPPHPICGLQTVGGPCRYQLTFVEKMDQGHLNSSHGRARPEDPGFRCTFPGCPETRQYAQKCNRNRHIKNHHWQFRYPCDHPGCTKHYGREDEVIRHRKSAHGL